MQGSLAHKKLRPLSTFLGGETWALRGSHQSESPGLAKVFYWFIVVGQRLIVPLTKSNQCRNPVYESNRIAVESRALRRARQRARNLLALIARARGYPGSSRAVSLPYFTGRFFAVYINKVGLVNGVHFEPGSI